MDLKAVLAEQGQAQIDELNEIVSQGRESRPKDHNDYDAWVAEGKTWERIFAETVLPLYGISAVENPIHKDDPTQFDLFVKLNGEVMQAELKRHFDPLYKAEYLAGIDKQWCITVNVRDCNEYRKKKGIDHCPIFFWMNFTDEPWEDKNGIEYRVKPMDRLWVCTLGDFNRFVASRKHPIVRLKKREGTGQADRNYAFDARERPPFIELKKLVEEQKEFDLTSTF